MKAVVVNEHGSIDKLVYTDFAEPEISPSEILVKVNACGINDLDIWTREGISGRWRLYSHVANVSSAINLNHGLFPA